MARKVEFEFDPFARTTQKISDENKELALDFIKDLVKEEVLGFIADGKSPVQGGPWKKSLSPGYKKIKGDASSSVFANLELTGELLDNLSTEVVGNKIRIFVAGDDFVTGKAEGNNIGSYGKTADDDKARRFIPLDGETWKKAIWDQIDNAIFAFADDE